MEPLERQLRFYDFFAGAGLATLGLSEKWECVWANDIDTKKAEVYGSNFDSDTFFLGDVARFTASDLPNSTTLAWASFPCQDLSLAGWQKGISADRSGAFWPFWKIMRGQVEAGHRPPIIVIENVVGLLYGDSFLGLCEALAALGLQFGALVIDARYFVPQSRPRVFLVCVDAGIDCSHLALNEPVAQWTPKGLRSAFASLPPEIKSLWRWWHLPVPQSTIAKLSTIIEKNPAGVRWHTKRETAYLLSLMNAIHKKRVREAQKSKKRHIGFLYKRMRRGFQRAEVRFDGLSGCLRTPQGGSSRQTVLIVDKGEVRTRLLSPREAARLMGVPDSFKLPDKYNDAYHAMGDAVVVPVVRWLSQHLLEPIASSISADKLNRNHHLNLHKLLENAQKRASQWTVDLRRKAMKNLESKCIDALKIWFSYEQAHLEGGSDRYVVCAGLAVLQVLKSVFPIREKDYLTDRNQVKTGGPLIKKILNEFGESRPYASEGGRTTRGTRPAAERLVKILNDLEEIGALSKQDRVELVKNLQSWLFETGVRPYFDRQKIEIDVNLDKPGSQIVADILEESGKRNLTGPVAQHLVGAKLSLRYPDLTVENYSYTTADQQLGRHGDFLVGDTVFHVTVAPMPAVIDKCGANIKNGFRAVLLVSEAKINAARELTDLAGYKERIWVASLEQFVGQNIEEIGQFGKTGLAKNLRALLEKYNERVEAIETDRRLLVEIPGNL